MKALSIKQPWAWLIVNGYKGIENRTWHLPESMRGQRIYVHAGKKPDGENYNNTKRIVADVMTMLPEDVAASVWELVYERNSHPGHANTWWAHYGAIVGEVDIVDCVTNRPYASSDSPWFVGPYGFVLDNPVAYDKPIPYSGRLGFFDVKLPVLEV